MVELVCLQMYVFIKNNRSDSRYFFGVRSKKKEARQNFFIWVSGDTLLKGGRSPFSTSPFGK